MSSGRVIPIFLRGERVEIVYTVMGGTEQQIAWYPIDPPLILPLLEEHESLAIDVLCRDDFHSRRAEWRGLLASRRAKSAMWTPWWQTAPRNHDETAR